MPLRNKKRPPDQASLASNPHKWEYPGASSLYGVGPSYSAITRGVNPLDLTRLNLECIHGGSVARRVGEGALRRRNGAAAGNILPCRLMEEREETLRLSGGWSVEFEEAV